MGKRPPSKVKELQLRGMAGGRLNCRGPGLRCGDTRCEDTD